MSFDVLMVRTGGEPETALFPEPGAQPDSIDLGPDDTNPVLYAATGLEVYASVDGHRQRLTGVRDVSISVIVTDDRVAFACSTYDKGGGWFGFGIGGVAVALTANAVSKAAAARRRRGRMLVGHVRHDWTVDVQAQDRRGLFTHNTMYLGLLDPTDRARVLTVEVRLANRQPASEPARDVARRRAARPAPPAAADVTRVRAAEPGPLLCPGCGRPMRSPAVGCGFCGMPAVSGGPEASPCVERDGEGRVVASSVASTGPAGPAPWPGPSSTPRPATPAPVVVAAVGLISAAGVLVYYGLRYGAPALPGLFSGSGSNGPESLPFMAEIGCLGTGLLIVAVGLLRASRLAWGCAIALALYVAADIVVFVLLQEHSIELERATWVVLSCLAAAVVLLLAPATSRAFATAARDVPLGADIGSAFVLVLGADLLTELFDANVVEYDTRGALIALGYVVIGAALVMLARGVRYGAVGARIAATITVSAWLVLALIAARSSHPAFYDYVVLVAAFATVTAVALWSGGVVTPTHGHRAVTPVPVLAALTAVVLAGGLTANDWHLRQDAMGQPPVVYSPPEVAAAVPVLESSDAAAVVMSEVEGDGAERCVGSTDELPGPITDYSIGQVTLTTSGSFAVSATVTLSDGSQEVVTYLVAQDSAGSACIAGATESGRAVPVSSEPGDVPSVPTSDEPVPTAAALPDAPSNPNVLAYQAASAPTISRQLVEYQPAGLNADQTAAVRDVIAFLVSINRQDFGAAWSLSTDSLYAASPSSSFRRGYATTEHYQVAFGQPEEVAQGLMTIPARFVSRQDPAAQGNPAGVTSCTYWPQYVFLVARVGGRWLDDVAGKFRDDPALGPLKRVDVSSGGKAELNPLSQRVSCA